VASSAIFAVSCTTVDPGPDFQLPTVQFNANYFFCVVEPQLIMGGLTGTPCGDNGSHGCHYSDKVPEMALIRLPQPVKCSGDVPVDQTQVATGTPAASNLATVSLQMNAVYTDAPIYLRPSLDIPGHPVKVFSVQPPLSKTDKAIVEILKTWATK
jgi:hypothetical protein